jgi:glycosyltransferase involved in cell wall biosynthesis
MPGQRLRVAYVYRNFHLNGSIESIYVRQAERLAQDEDVTVFCSTVERIATSAPLRFADVEPIARGQDRFRYAAECASFARRATRSLRERSDEFDVVHVEGTAAHTADLVTVHAVRPAEIEHYFAKVEPRARVRHLTTRLLRPQSSVVMGIERRLFATHPLCLTPTRRIKDDLRREYGVPAELIEIIPYPVKVELPSDEAGARARVRAEQGVPSDRLVALFVGRDFERKGLSTAIESIARCAALVELWVVGGGQAGPYRDVAARLGIAERVRFFGPRPTEELGCWYAAADVLLLPSLQDAWGLPVVEAMAAGRVAVASEYAGSHEAIESGLTGYVVTNDGASAEIAALLDGPLSDPHNRATIGERAARAAAGYRFDAIYPRLLNAHRRAYERRGDVDARRVAAGVKFLTVPS